MSQFEKGHLPDTSQQQAHPGLEAHMDPSPAAADQPDENSGYQTYKAAGKLEGKRALITGGDSGIGRATAILFAMEDASGVSIVYLADEEKDATDTKEMIEKLGKGTDCILLPADLTLTEECHRIVDETVQQLGGLEIVVNNAGYQMTQDNILDISDDQWDRTFKTNIYAYFHICKRALPHLRKSKGCSIINMASVTAYSGSKDLLDYVSTKGAIVAFTRSLSNQLIGEGIRVNAIAPGSVWTPLVVATMSKERLDGSGGAPMGRPGQPIEIATCCVFLAGPDSSFMSGSTLHPNGGKFVAN